MFRKICGLLFLSLFSAMSDAHANTVWQALLFEPKTMWLIPATLLAIPRCLFLGV